MQNIFSFSFRALESIMPARRASLVRAGTSSSAEMAIMMRHHAMLFQEADANDDGNHALF